MLKLTILLLSALVLVRGTDVNDPEFLKQFQPCGEAMLKKIQTCLAGVPDEVKNMKDLKELAHHPERCCPAYKLMNCTKEAAQKVPECAKFQKLLMDGFDKELKEGFIANGCKVEKCH